MKQLTLFPSPKPLALRFGEDFFRGAPRSAGVYIMTGEAGRVLYIGQSKNLRARLSTYKNARPDCAPRKIVRLVHEVRSIVWEKCDSAEAAKSRESQLLRVHRPKFNVAGTWPAPPRYFRVRLSGGELQLDCFPDRGDSDPLEEPVEGVRQFGPFKASFLGLYAALLRLLWAATHNVCSQADYPAGFFSAKPPRPARFIFGTGSGSRKDGDEAVEFFSRLCDFLNGRTETFTSWLKSRAASAPSAEDVAATQALSFQEAMVALDLETIELFGRILQRPPRFQSFAECGP